MYRALVFIAVAVFSVSAQLPEPCKAPPAFYGKMVEFDSKRIFNVFANFTYDALEERVRIDESISKMEESREYYDIFVFFKERLEYKINLKTKECIKSTLPESAKFRPIEVPPGATSRGAAVIGTNAGPGIGVEVDLWSGDTEEGRYFGSWTRVACIPVQDFRASPSGDLVRQSFYDIRLGYDPNKFIPPSNCQ